MLGLAACQHVAPTSDRYVRWHEDGQRFEKNRLIASLPQWRYNAKVGIKTPSVSEQANMVWQHRDQANNVRLFGPLGAGAIEVDFDAYGVQLSDSKGRLYHGHSAEQLLTEIAGWPIPVEALAYWLFVAPLPGEPFRYQLDTADQVSVIEQLGWLIHYSDYRDYGVDEKLQQFPRKLTVSKQVEAADSYRVTVKLITLGWQW